MLKNSDKKSPTGNINDQPYMKKYKELLELKVKLKRVTYSGADDENNKLVARDLNGNEKWALFTYISETELECFNLAFPEIKNINKIHKVSRKIIKKYNF